MEKLLIICTSFHIKNEHVLFTNPTLKWSSSLTCKNLILWGKYLDQVINKYNNVIPMMMIIEIGLCRLGIRFFFVIKIITPWSSTTTIINSHLVDICVRMTKVWQLCVKIMKIWVVFFLVHFFCFCFCSWLLFLHLHMIKDHPQYAYV